MATIEKYTTSAGETRYMVRYRKPDHRQTKKRGFTTKRDAEAYAATVEVQKLSGSYVSPSLGRIKVSQLADEWLARKQIDLKPSSYKSIATAWRVHVKPYWGHKRLTDIDLGAVEAWIAEMRREVVDVDQDGNRVVTKKAAGATVVLRAYGVLAGILDAAVKARRLSSNPARTPENLPRKQPKRRVYLNHSQVEALAAAAKYPTLIRFLAYTGLRWGEAIALRVEHLDLARKRVEVAENAVQVEQIHHVGTPKSGEARVSAIPEFLVFELRALVDGRPPDALVFAGDNGGYLLRPKSERGWFDRAVVRSGVPTVTLHDLRHTAASLAISAGVNVKALQRMLGHASAAMTLDVYSDLFDDDLDAIGVALDQARSAASVPKLCPSGAQTSTNRA